MTRTDTAALALRIGALYLGLNVLLLLTHAGSLALDLGVSYGGGALLLGYLGAAVLLVLAGVLLFHAAPKLARRMAGGDEDLQLEDRSAIGSIALRLAGVILWDAALQRLPSVTLTANTSPWAYFAGHVAIVLVLVGFGTWLFVCAPAIGERWFGSSPRATTASAAILPSIAFAAVGLLLLVNALPSFILSVIDVIQHADLYASGLSSSWRELISSALRVAFGTVLFVGGGATTRLWERLSKAGLKRENDAA